MKTIRFLVFAAGFAATVFGGMQAATQTSYSRMDYGWCYDPLTCPVLCYIYENPCWVYCNEARVERTCSQPLCDDAC